MNSPRFLCNYKGIFFRRITLFLSLVCGLFHICSAQEASEVDSVLECGTYLEDFEEESLIQFNLLWSNYYLTNGTSNLLSANLPTLYVPVQIHIIRTSAGSGGLTEIEADRAFDRMNDIYIGANVHFYYCAPIHFIDDDTYFDYDKTQMANLDFTHGVANVLNIYVANSVTSGGSGICGHAQFPGGLDFAMQALSCMNNGSTLSHEVGHYFGLYHTHSTGFGAEAVDGSDCSVEGDLLCDTPADPQLSTVDNLDNAGCIYYGSDLDENGDAYNPQVYNLMSYSAKECRTGFTPEQLARIRWTLINHRSYLTCGIPPLEAYFYKEYQPTCSSSKQFSFYNASKGSPSSYNWDFGDGLATSTLESPDYTYVSSGVYKVQLVVTAGMSTDTFSQLVTIGARTLPFIKDFEIGEVLLDSLETIETMKNILFVSDNKGKDGSKGLIFDGTDISQTNPFFQTPNISNAFESLWNPYFKSGLKICIDATNNTSIQMTFDKKQLYVFNDNYTNLRVTVNDTLVGSVYQVENSGNDDSDFSQVIIDLSSYDGEIFYLGIEGSHKYNINSGGEDGGNATIIDNIAITGDLELLPIELIRFNAESINNSSVEIEWETSSELNNDYFIVQRSQELISWEPVVKIPGAGTSVNINKYSVMDYSPILGDSYYRLEQYDFNGVTIYSDVRIVHLDSEPILAFAISPNPVGAILDVELSQAVDGFIFIYNLQGKIL